MNILDLLKPNLSLAKSDAPDWMLPKSPAPAPADPLNNQVPFDPAIKAYPDSPELQSQSDFLSQFKNLGMAQPDGNINMQLAAPMPETLSPIDSSRSMAAPPIKLAKSSAPVEAQSPPMSEDAYTRKMLREGSIPLADEQKSNETVAQNLKQLAQKQQESKDDDYLNLLKEAQGKSKEELQQIALIEAMDKIGQSVARQGRTPINVTGYDQFRQAAKQGVLDIKEQEELSQKLKQQKREQAKFGMDQQKFEKDMKMSDINLDKATLQMGDEKAKRDPNSEFSKMAREANAKELDKIGMKDVAKQLREGSYSAQQIEDLYGQYKLTDLMKTWESTQARAMDYSLKKQDKQNTEDTKRLDAANKIITASISRNNTAFGKSAGVLRSAEAIETMVANMDPKNIDNRQITELARNLDAMLTSGAATVSGMQKLIPRTMTGDTAKISEYITSLPKGAGQEAFVKKMLETVAREKQLAGQQIQRESGKLLSSYADLQKKKPEEWNLMMQQHGMNPDLFKNIGEKQAPEAPKGGLTPAQEAGVANFMKANNIQDKQKAIKILKDHGKL